MRKTTKRTTKNSSAKSTSTKSKNRSGWSKLAIVLAFIAVPYLLIAWALHSCSSSGSDGHMPSSEKEKYEDAQKALKNIDSKLNRYTSDRSQENLEDLINTCATLQYDYDASEMDSIGVSQCQQLKEQVDATMAEAQKVLANDICRLYFPLLRESDHLLEGACTWPFYLRKGTTLRYSVSSSGNFNLRLINVDASKIVKTYTAKKLVEDSLAIANSAIYLVEITPSGSEYFDIEVSQRYSRAEQLSDSRRRIVVDTVECGPTAFMAVKAQGININPLFTEPKKATLRAVGKTFFGGSSRAVITLDVPKGCTDMLYSLRISNNEGDKSSDGEFDKNVTRTYKKVRFLGLPLYEREKKHSNLFRELLYDNKPPREEESYCNVYVFTNQAQAKKFQDGKHVDELKYDIDLSLMGTRSCNGRIPTKGLSKIYLGFDNERFRYSTYLWLEVLTSSPKTEYYRLRYQLAD